MAQTETTDTFIQTLKNHKTKLAILGLAALLFMAFNASNSGSAYKFSSIDSASATSLGNLPVTIPNMRWGFAIDTFEVAENTIQNNQFFGEVLQENKVPYPTIQKILAETKDVFNVNNWRVGKNYFLLTNPGDTAANHLVYVPNVYEYYHFDLKNGTGKKVENPIKVEQKTASGVIQSSLWKTMTDAGLSFDLAGKMENALQWSIDFHHAQKGDQFKVFYEEESIDGKPVGVGKVYAATYKTAGTEYQAVYFDSPSQPGYYDIEGRPMNKGFLKSPVKYARISSSFNRNRFHPILKRRKAHLGTDYAAPYGTPILAVGDGVVVEATRRGGNGKFVKIRHDKTYQTQYLHMQKFAKGISPGVHVKQGQTIGYVGSTGLATGPHVCFRFWKNGKQVNHRRLEFPPPKPLPDTEMPAFAEVRDSFVATLATVVYPELIEETEEVVEEEAVEENEVEMSNP